MGIQYTDNIKKVLKKETQWLEEGLAFVTHYWQSSKNGISVYYKAEAEEYISQIAEPDFVYKLPFEYNVPFPPPKKPSSILSSNRSRKNLPYVRSSVSSSSHSALW